MGYWENRQAKAMYEAMEDAEVVAQEIADIYVKTSRELNYKLSKVYERYRDKHNMTDEEAVKLLNSMYDITDIEELKAQLKGLSAKSDEAKEILKELESPAYRVRLERLQNLQQEIDIMMKNVYQQEKKVSTKHYVSQYSNAYYREIYNVQRKAGFQFSFSMVDAKEVNRVLNMDWSGANYSKRIWGNTQGLAKELKEQMMLGYLTGKLESDMAAEIAKKYGKGAFYARRLVRTEAAFISGQGQRAGAQECEIEKYRNVATLDVRTSEKCREMDGKEFDYNKSIVGENYPPYHPFCRTTVISVLEDENLSKLKRRARNPITGKNEVVKADITYPEWYNKNVANNPIALAAEKMAKNFASDKTQYERYLKVVGKAEAGKTFADFQDMKYNDVERWNDVKGFAEYIKKYPDSGRPYYNITRDLKAEGLKVNVCLPAKKKVAYILPEGTRDPYHIMNRMLERNITDDELRSYIDSAQIMFSQWGGSRQWFLTREGATVITRRDDEWIIKTGYKAADFDEDTLKILEVMKKYGK